MGEVPLQHKRLWLVEGGGKRSEDDRSDGNTGGLLCKVTPVILHGVVPPDCKW